MRTFSKLSLMLFTAFLCFGSISELKAQFLFSPNNFTVVDRTVNRWNDTSSFATDVGFNPNCYRLTDAISYQRLSMWHNQQLDLSKDFIFDFRLNFGIKDDGADGFVFVMHNKFGTVLSSLIGNDGGYLGYGGISGSSYGVEFDTYYNYDFVDPYSDHISYLQDGAMGSDLMVPIQDDSANVETGEWYCIRVVWKRTNSVDGSAGYDLHTYTVENGNNSPDVGKLKLRASKHFTTLGDLINGLVPDANGRAFVTWGITSATGVKHNRHEIEFLSMFNGNLFDENFGTVSAISGIYIARGENYRLTPEVSLSGGCGVLEYGFRYHNDFVLCPTDGPLLLQLPFGLADISSAVWYIYDDRDTAKNFKRIDSSDGEAEIDLNAHKEYFAGKDSIKVKLELNGVEYYIDLKLAYNRPTMAETLKDIKLDFVLKDDLSAEIDLPELTDSCEYVIETFGNTAGIDNVFVDENNKLRVYLQEGFCNVSIRLSRSCDLPCEDYVTFTFNEYKTPDSRLINSCSGMLFQLGIPCSDSKELPVKYSLKHPDGGSSVEIDDINPTNLSDYGAYADSSGIYTIETYDMSDSANPVLLDSFVVVSSDSTIESLSFPEIVNVTSDSLASGKCRFYIEFSSLDTSKYQINFSSSSLDRVFRPQYNGLNYVYTIFTSCAEGAITLAMALQRKADDNFFLFVDCTDTLELFCSCPDPCEELGSQMRTGAYSWDIENNQRVRGEHIQDSQMVSPKMDTNRTCDFTIELPPGVTQADIIPSNLTFDNGKLLINMSSPCADPGFLPTLGSGSYLTNEQTFEFSVVHTDEYGFVDTCTYTQVFRCSCYSGSGNGIGIIVVKDPLTQVVRAMSVNFEDSSSNPRVPVTFWLYDWSETKLEPVYYLPLSDPAFGTFELDMSAYSSGTYYIVAEDTIGQVRGYTSFEFNNDLILSADVLPNVTSGDATISYTLRELPASALRISIVESISGMEQMLVYEDIPTTMLGTLPINISGLSSGVYLVKFELDNQILQVPFTLSVVKQ